MNWFGLGKERSRLGKWLDQRGIPQNWLEKESKISKTTVSKLCSEKDYSPSGSTAKKVLTALKKLDKSISYEDFWM